MSTVYGYARVSSKGQNLNRQLDALHNLGIPDQNIITDKASGKTFNRPGYKLLLSKLKDGDILYIASLDRLGRNYFEIPAEWHKLVHEIGVNIRVLDLDTLNTHKNLPILKKMLSDVTLVITAYNAHSEREKIRERQRQGIAAAKARGVVFGRKPIALPESFNTVYTAFVNKEINGITAAKLLGLSPSTFYRRAKERTMHPNDKAKHTV
ncbi:MAG: recombinase family protein [Desulfovibrio sp.]|nr:recombinase family protein [Desulfovibrio sp.]